MANFVSQETEQDINKRQNFLYVAFLFSALWVFFHFAAVTIFLFLLDSIALTGLFLGLGNLCAIFMGVPSGILQKYIKSKTLVILSCGLMFIVVAIFLYLVIAWGAAQAAASAAGSNIVFSGLGWVFGSFFNIILMLLAALIYGLIKELYDVTGISYIMNTSDPSIYAEVLAKNDTMEALGSVAGLGATTMVFGVAWFLSEDILGSSLITLLALVIACLAIMGFVYVFMDRTDKTLGVEDLKKLKFIARTNKDEIKKYVVKTVTKENLIKVMQQVRVIILQPIRERKQVNKDEIIKESKSQFHSVFKMFFIREFQDPKLLWFAGVILVFGVWNTFVLSFLVKYIQQILSTGDLLIGPGFAYPMLGLLAIPVFVLQIPFIRLAKKIGYFTVITSGMIISAVAMIFFVLPAPALIFFIFALVNSAGYAAGMPLAKALFSERYNEVYAKKHNLSNIDANTSAAPMKMLINVANVLALVVGGFILGVINFKWVFFIYALMLLAAFGVSLKFRYEWKLK